jgi:hypothetical protein
MHGALGKAAHPQQALLEDVHVFFEVAFHQSLSFNNPLRQKTEERFLASPEMTARKETHPKRPVM